MRQAAVQSNMILQAAGVLLALALGLKIHETEPTIYWPIGAHAFGAAVALGVAVFQFWCIARAETEAGNVEGCPSWREMTRYGLENYSYALLNVLAAADVMTLLGRRLLEVAEFATFGFIHNLYLRLERFVPGRFFVALLRPTVIVRFHADSSFEEMNRRVVLILKLSLSVWAALAALFVVAGESIVAVLSAGKYAGGYGLMIGFVVLLAIRDIKLLVVMVVNTLRRSTMLRRAGLIYLLSCSRSSP